MVSNEEAIAEDKRLHGEEVCKEQEGRRQVRFRGPALARPVFPRWLSR